MIKITYKLILLLGLLAMTVTSFAASEAEYGKVSKAWTCMPYGTPRMIDPYHGIRRSSLHTVDE